MGWYGLVVLVVATVFGALDRQILLLLAEPMRLSLHLSDTELGLLQGVGFTLFAGVAAVPIGWLADRYGRRAMLSICVLVWSASTAACGLVHDFSTLFVAAAGMGMGEAGLVPIIYGLIPEIVPERRRVLTNGIYVLAVLLGGGLGIALGGVLLNHLESIRSWMPFRLDAQDAWRLAFLCVAVPGPLIAALILAIRVRGSSEATHRDASTGPLPALADYLRTHLRTFVGVFGGIGFGQLGLVATAIWMPVISARSYGATTAQVGQGIGVAYMVGTLAGALVGTVVVRRLRPRLGLATPGRVIVVGVLGSATCAAAMLFAQSAGQLYFLFGAQMASITAGTLLVPTLCQDIAPAQLRSRVIAIGTFALVALTSLSPLLVGALSDALSASPRGLLVAVTAVSMFGLVTAAAFLHSARACIVHTARSVSSGAGGAAQHTFMPHLEAQA